MDFSCPAYVLFRCLSVPVCLFLPSSVSFLVHSTILTSLIPPLILPHFPYFGMSMCYLLTLCMNDNMYVYSYKRIPFPWCWLKMVWMLYRFRFSVHLLFHFSYLFNVCRASQQYVIAAFVWMLLAHWFSYLLLLLLKRQYLLLLIERGHLEGVISLKQSIWELHGLFEF